jgi:collagenase-like PrtC family protease
MENIEKRFCVPYNGDYYGIVKIVESYKEHIHEFYGCDGRLSSARFPYDTQKTLNSKIYTFKKTMEYLNGNSINFNYTLNNVYLNDYLNIEKLKSLLQDLKSMKVESITLSYPYLIPYVKETGFKIVHSVLQNVDSDLKIQYLLEYGGGDRFIVHGNYTRQINFLRYLKSIIPKESPLEILSNLICRINCPNETMHYMGETQSVGDFCYSFCKKEKRTIRDYLQRVWIRHKDVKKYQDIGINFFKLMDRTMPSDLIYFCVKYFIEGIKTPSSDNSSIYPSYFKDFSTGVIFTDDDLDEYFDFVFSERCTGRCTECKYCDIYADKLQRKYNLNEAFMKLEFPPFGS